MRQKLILTSDGSHSIEIPDMQVTYHSVHGAIQESMHIFIQAGLHHYWRYAAAGLTRIFEMGMGTGLNALLTMSEADKTRQPVFYQAIELYPLENAQVKELNYCTQLNRPDLQLAFEKLHSEEWDKDIILSPYFTFRKLRASFVNTSITEKYNLVYYDAFAPAAQPELWTKEIFEKLYAMLLPGGSLVTYCSKGDVRRAMQQAGFHVQKIPGPPGKREMQRATKLLDKTNY
jgi:tRNA U34 5-methylaminomethyl-2-thiouridine-forming methyltransferase MnmC